MSEPFWNDLESNIHPWVKSFSRMIKSISPPLLKGDTILISSDYSGDLAKSKYTVFSNLVIDLSHIMQWDIRRSSIRTEFLKDNRRMSFKGLNDSLKQKALPFFLDSADSLKGTLINIAISKEIKSLLQAKGMLRVLNETNMLQSKWKFQSFNKMATLTHFIALIIAGIAQSNQNVYWYSDEDMLFANDKTSSDVSKVLGILSAMYVKANLGELGIGTTKLNQPDFFEEDINAIPDLAAGALSEFFTKTHSLLDKNSLQGFAYLFPKDLSDKSDLIIQWLSHSSNTLKKITIVFDRINERDGYKIWKFDTMPNPITSKIILQE